MRFAFGVAMIACGFAGSVAAEALHIEPGLWNVTYSYSLQGEPPASVLAKLSPEKRAEMMKEWEAKRGQTKTNTSHACITAEELANGTAFENDPDEPGRDVSAPSGRRPGRSSTWSSGAPAWADRWNATCRSRRLDHAESKVR